MKTRTKKEEKNSHLQSSKTNTIKNQYLKVKNKDQGITLIALVVTIVVLLILAGITITFVLGENGIINMAQRAADATNKAVEKEQEDLKNITDQMQDYLNGNSGGGNTGSGTKVSDLIGKPADSSKNQDVQDEYGNKITIPAGFTVVPDGTDNVEYKYNGDKKPVVQDGIVVQDGEGNQFVWIPVGEIINKDKSKTTIDLARYTFNVGTYDYTTETLNGTGEIANKVTDGSELKESSTATYGYLEEPASSTTYGNSKAKDIEGFKTSANTKGGYYLARYEASKKVVEKADGETEEIPMSKANQDTWGNITQPNASSAAQAMYTNPNYTSDLINSYAWDTAIVFIQTYGGEENKAYSKQTSKNTSLAKTGVSGDKVCNIYDMASNTAEWTTETSTNAGVPCASRGGSYDDSGYYTSGRGNNGTTYSLEFISFRSTLYTK